MEETGLDSFWIDRSKNPNKVATSLSPRHSYRSSRNPKESFFQENIFNLSKNPKLSQNQQYHDPQPRKEIKACFQYLHNKTAIWCSATFSNKKTIFSL